MITDEILSQIQSLTKPSDSHLIWIGAKSYNGKDTPGVLTLKGNAYRPHRNLYQHKHPDTQFTTLTRLCDKSMCINPDHFIHKDEDAAMDHNGFSYYDRTVMAHRLKIMTTPPTELTNECIERSKKYSQIKYQGKFYGAHRLSLMLTLNEPLNPLQDVCHKCNNPKCVNPRHLCQGTRKQNAADKVDNKTAPIAEKNPSAKLTNDDAKKIYAAKGGNVYDLSKLYKISVVTIRQIWNGTSWSSVTGAAKRSRKRKRSELPLELDDEWRNSAAKMLDRICKFEKDDNGIQHRVPQTDPNAEYKDVHHKGVNIKAHILAAIIKYKLTERPDSLGIVVRHKCRNTGCCHYDHIELGTQKDNGRDKIRDKTNRNHARISEETAKVIKQSKGEGTIKERAARFGVSFATVAHIDYEESWQHVEADEYEVSLDK